MSRGPLDSGCVAWLAGLAPLLAVDAVLVASGHPSLSQHARGHRVVASLLLAYLSAHLLMSLPHDPLARCAKFLAPHP